MSTRLISILLCVLMLLSGCTAEADVGGSLPAVSLDQPESSEPIQTEQPQGSAPAEDKSSAAPRSEKGAAVLFQNAIPLKNDYIQSVADQVRGEIITSEMNDVQRLLAAYEWIIRRSYFVEPVGLDIWRYRGDPEAETPFAENRALSILLYGLGECEDYASAMVVLARRMGYEAEYVFGMTVSIHGQWVDHAWAAVKVGELWYHLDPQLEDNVMRGGQMRSRYFMRSDAVMRADHLWGEELIERRGGLTDAQIMKIRDELTPPECRGEVRPMEPEPLEKAPRPDRQAIERELSAERAAYVLEHGELPPLTLDISPPMEIYDPEIY